MILLKRRRKNDVEVVTVDRTLGCDGRVERCGSVRMCAISFIIFALQYSPVLAAVEH